MFELMAAMSVPDNVVNTWADEETSNYISHAKVKHTCVKCLCEIQDFHKYSCVEHVFKLQIESIADHAFRALSKPSDLFPDGIDAVPSATLGAVDMLCAALGSSKEQALAITLNVILAKAVDHNYNIGEVVRSLIKLHNANMKENANDDNTDISPVL